MATMNTKKAFLEEHHLTEQDLTDARQNWESLEAIAEDHQKNVQLLEEAGQIVMERLRHARDVHTIRMRVKGRAKLVRKVVRKCRDDSSRIITLQNYKNELTDLVGIRALHLFKEDWRSIHDNLSRGWELVGAPVAYIRKGDPQSWVDQFEDRGCAVEEHPRAYRSVHYLVRGDDPSGTIVEVQVRTLIEEAWSEIDHRINYPEANESSIVRIFLGMFNRLAGNADEMGTFVNLLLTESKRRSESLSSQESERNYALTRVSTIVHNLPVNQKVQQQVERQLHDLIRNTMNLRVPESAESVLGDAGSLESALRAAEYISHSATPIQLSDILREWKI
jgi:putative GTP pyrophosphokinase